MHHWRLGGNARGDKLQLVVADQFPPRFANSLNYTLFGAEGLSGLANFVQRCNAQVAGNGNTAYLTIIIDVHSLLPATHLTLKRRRRYLCRERIAWLSVAYLYISLPTLTISKFPGIFYLPPLLLLCWPFRLSRPH